MYMYISDMHVLMQTHNTSNTVWPLCNLKATEASNNLALEDELEQKAAGCQNGVPVCQS